MLAVLMSVEYSRATMVVSGGPPPASDTRLKRDIAQVGEVDNGINLYRYRYLWSDTTYVGVMAQEVAEVIPEAVAARTGICASIMRPGYYPGRVFQQQ